MPAFVYVSRSEGSKSMSSSIGKVKRITLEMIDIVSKKPEADDGLDRLKEHQARQGGNSPRSRLSFRLHKSLRISA